MTDINIGLAFAAYLVNPSVETAEAVVVALESRPDLPITAEQTRKALLEGIDQIRAMTGGTSIAQTSSLMQRLMDAKR